MMDFISFLLGTIAGMWLMFGYIVYDVYRMQREQRASATELKNEDPS